MSQLRELLDTEARRIEASPGAFEAALQLRDRRQRNRRIGTALFALALFGIVAASLSAALHDRSSEPMTHPAVHSNGDIAVHTTLPTSVGAMGLVSVDPVTGRTQPLFAGSGPPGNPSLQASAWSPDGRSLLYKAAAWTWWVFDAASDRSQEILSRSAADLVWSPDGASIAYQSSGAVWVLNMGSGAVSRIGSCGPSSIPLARLCRVAWSPDGQRLAVAHEFSIDVAATDGGGQSTLVPRTNGAIKADPLWSPDGRSLLFLVGAAGAPDSQLYRVDGDGTGLRKTADLPGGEFASTAAWSPDGTKIAYLAAGRAFLPKRGHRLRATVVAVDGATPPVAVPVGSCYCLGFSPGIEWSPDGTQLALVVPGPGPGNPIAGLYVMNTDGTGLRLLRKGAWGQPAWGTTSP